jgi:hypothetical protein
VYGSISGRVMSEDGPVPFAGITVSPASGRGAGNSSRNATADAEGNFKVDGLRAIAWSVYAAAPGYVMDALPDDEEPDQPHHRVGDNVTIRMVKGGVITGRVLSATGEPVIAVRVGAELVSDAQGKRAKNAVLRQAVSGDFQTDDRGVYRIYGLPPGTYVVVASPASGFGPGGRRSPYDGDAPVYHPANTRDAAAEVVVNSGAETGGIDIQYRSEKGRAVSGKVIAPAPEGDRVGGFTSVTLTHAATGAVINTAFVGPRGRGENSASAFSMHGVPDGEYEIAAQRNSPGGDLAASAPRRVVVIGRDVAGIELTLKPLASVAGRLLLESASKCAAQRPASFEEQLFALRAEEAVAGEQKSATDPLRPTAPDRSGELAFRGLSAGRYRLVAQMLDEKWFIRSITFPIAAPASASKTSPRPAAKPSPAPSWVDAGRNGLNLKSGERLAGLIVNVTEGAAAIKGKVKVAEGATLPSRLRVHLIPVERERADDLLRYAETEANGDGAFRLSNLAPGKYWLLARSSARPDKSWPEAFDAAARTRLRREAEAANQVVELQPCQRLADYDLPLKKTPE